ncbi:hypothetical protein [Streptomyces sp. NPDC057909]|uniref:hypothetical protein n=1 Tax=Streptomyces sp. NPDC057909 TaxID=3346277 RepID=UPI0036EAB9A9
MLADAPTLLDRYGPTARYWTNATAAASGPAPDFLAAGLQGTESHGFLTSEYLNGLDFFEGGCLLVVRGVLTTFGEGHPATGNHRLGDPATGHRRR